jgi:putative transposase
MSIAVSGYRYCTRRSDESLREKLVRLAREKPRYGYRRSQVLVQREGERVNHKRLWRVYREAGLCLKRKKRRRRVRVGSPRPALTGANQEWALDFAHDVIAAGRNIRVLSVVDAFTRECLALEPDVSPGSGRVTRVLETVIAEHDLPESLRSDNVLTREGRVLKKKRFLSIPYGMAMTVSPSGFDMQGWSDRP